MCDGAYLGSVADFIAYRDRYSFPLGEEILDEVGASIRKQKYLTYKQLLKISDWKAGRRNRRHIHKNQLENVVEVTRHAFSSENDELRVKSLHSPNLDGVRVPVASAILTFHNPSRYGVIDRHTSRSLYRNRSTLRGEWELDSRFFRKRKLVGFTIDDYIEYLRVIRKIARKVSEESGTEFTPRDVDKALWQEDKENGGPLSRARKRQ